MAEVTAGARRSGKRPIHSAHKCTRRSTSPVHTNCGAPTCVTSWPSASKYVLNRHLKQALCTAGQKCPGRQRPTKAANFTPTLLGPRLGTAVKHRQRDRWYRAGRGSFYCPLCTHTCACVCRQVCILCRLCTRVRSPASLCIFKHHFVLHTPADASGYASRGFPGCFLLPSQMSGNVTPSTASVSS